MKGVSWVIGLFALAVGLSLFAQINTGYAILFMPPFRVELSLNMAIVLALGLLALSYMGLRMLAAAVGLPRQVARYQRRKKLRAARHALAQASLAFTEGRHQRAEREALQAFEGEFDPTNRALALVLAARSAHAMRDNRRRDAHLAKMESLPAATQLARHMVTAEMLLDEKRLGEALAAVEAARVLSPNLTAALKLELKIRQLQNTPEPVLTLTEKLLKSDAISPEQARRYRLAAYREQLRQYIDPRELRQWWQKIPAQERQNPVLANAVAAHYVQLGNADAAAALLLVELGDTPSPEILLTLGQLADTVSDSVRLDMVRQGERRLQSHSRDPDLLLMLGRLARAQQLWGKAQSYFEASLSIAPTLTAHAELAQLLQSLDRPDEARQHVEASVALALAAAAT